MVKTNLPVLFLRGVILLPNNEIRIELNIEKDKEIIKTSELYHDGHILLVSLRDFLEEKPSLLELPEVAIIGRIKSKIELPNGIIRIVIVGIDRVEVLNYLENEHDNIEAFIIPCNDYDIDAFEASAIKRILLRDLNNFIENSQYMSNSVIGRLSGTQNINVISDIIAYELPLSYEQKLKYIEVANPIKRSKMVIEDINKELETVKLENSIELELRKELDNSQKEFVLREKIKLIKQELGEANVKEEDIEGIRHKIDTLEAPESVKTRLASELSRYELSPASSPEITMIRNYIEWLLNIPWQISTKDSDNLTKVRKYLDDSHYGLDKVKQRIIEYIAVKKNTRNSKSPIICLVGPPGTGKTTLARSIAGALNKKFIKISVGGVNDEAEIMGHRRTYIGANPGKIIQGLKKAGTNNPVFLIDEIDKMTKDYRGDPASALLDILDKEQNYMFSDNYIEEEVDLSKVMFILTANSITTIPLALKDRLEIIELSSYTIYEKLSIGKNYLIPKLLEELNINEKNFNITDEAIMKIITDYTKESGARELERMLSTIMRKIIVSMLTDGTKKFNVTVDNLSEYLGISKWRDTENSKEIMPGVINGLGYTGYGGSILKVSSTYYKGKGNVTITGSIGDVMKESVSIAISYIKANHELFNIDINKLEKNDIHIHFEEGATPKDGPSAGITTVSCLISLFSDYIIPSNISMTGEITLRGIILPIGGLKEKLIAATTNNINEVYIPKDNEKDLEDIPDYIKEKLKIKLVDNYLDIYKSLFKK